MRIHLARGVNSLHVNLLIYRLARPPRGCSLQWKMYIIYEFAGYIIHYTYSYTVRIIDALFANERGLHSRKEAPLLLLLRWRYFVSDGFGENYISIYILPCVLLCLRYTRVYASTLFFFSNSTRRFNKQVLQSARSPAPRCFIIAAEICLSTFVVADIYTHIIYNIEAYK